MTTSSMPPTLQGQVRTALARVGYSEIAEQYNFQLSESDHPEAAPLPLVAFWQETRDQFGSAIAVRWLSADRDRIETYLKPIANDLWAPYQSSLGLAVAKSGRPSVPLVQPNNPSGD